MTDPLQIRFERSFFARPATRVARDLLGCYVHRRIKGKEMIGRIVETEAYHQDDPASHSYRGITPRTELMFGEAGYAYVYFTYGMHFCMNVVTGAIGTGEAVLFRALEPVSGTSEMFIRRIKAKTERDLLSGPAKICQAFDVGKPKHGEDFVYAKNLYLTQGSLRSNEKTLTTTRVGISVGIEKKWRFIIDGNPFVSKGRTS
ncbi:MAG: DNA-3-methyladenine glycosylase [bacterium]